METGSSTPRQSTGSGVFLLQNRNGQRVADQVKRWLVRGNASTFADRVREHFDAAEPTIAGSSHPRGKLRPSQGGGIEDAPAPPSLTLRLAPQRNEFRSTTEPTEGQPESGSLRRYLVGAVPFDPREDDYLFEPVELRRVAWTADDQAIYGSGHGDSDRDDGDSDSQPAVSLACVREVPSGQQYAAAVARTVSRLAAADCPATPTLEKVVLARSLEIAIPTPIDPWALVQRLPADPHATTFLASLPDQYDHADGRQTQPVYLAGATPELLVSRRGQRVVSNPLAGSAPRSNDPKIDRATADRLLGSAKDLHEHRFVVQAIAEALAPFCESIQVPDRPELQSTATMWHLGTRITAVLRDPSIHVSQLVAALHPTPAVCGTPTRLALQTILQTEAFSRGFYGGAVGWLDDQGDGDWYVAIRCAQLQPRSIRLFAGAGVVADSDPASELAETTAKLRTWFRTLGIADPSDQPNEPMD